MAGRLAGLIIECRGTVGLGGAPIRARLDDQDLFLAWDSPQQFVVPAGKHGIEICHEPVRWPFGANKISNSIELNAGFRYYLTYIPRLIPTLPAKIEIRVDRLPA